MGQLVLSGAEIYGTGSNQEQVTCEKRQGGGIADGGGGLWFCRWRGAYVGHEARCRLLLDAVSLQAPSRV